MKFSKRVNYLLIGFLVLLNVVFRYPSFPHEIGDDSFIIHSLSNTISVNGCAKWVVHPLSLFGFYPFSKSSGELFLLSGASQSTGIEIEVVILLISTLLGIFAIFTAYIMAREFKNDDLFTFIIAFNYSLTPTLLGFTTWTISTRGMFMVFLPLFIWSLLRCRHRLQSVAKNIALTLLFFVTLLSTHRMSILIPLILISYVGAVIFYRTYREFFTLFTPSYKKIVIAVCRLSIISFILITFFLLLNPNSEVLSAAREYWLYGHHWKGSGFYTILLNMGYYYMKIIGALVFFGVVGFIAVLVKPTKYSNKFESLFPTFLIIIGTPLLIVHIYSPEFFMIVFCIFIGYGIVTIVTLFKRYKKIVFIIIIVSMLIFLVYAKYISNYGSLDICKDKEWRDNLGNTLWVNEETYNTALFMHQYSRKTTFACNENRIARRIYAISGIPNLRDMNYFVYDLADIDDLEIEMTSIFEIYSNGTFYHLKNKDEYNPARDWRILMYTDSQNRIANAIILRYDIEYMIESKLIDGRFGIGKFGDTDCCIRLESIYEEKIKIYENGLQTIWYIGL